MRRRLKIRTGVARIIWICCLTVFFTSVGTIGVFYYFFGDELIADAVRRVVERTVGYRVSLTGIRLVSPSEVSVEGMGLVIGSTVFSSGPAILEFRLGLNPALAIKKVSVRNPSVLLDMSGGGGDGDRIIRTLMKMDIVVTDGDFVVSDKAGKYTFRGMDISYERDITGATLAFEGSALNEGGGNGPILNGPFNGRVHVSGTYPDVTVRGKIKTEGSGYRIGEYVFWGNRLDAHVRLDRDIIEATDVSITGLSITNGVRGLHLDGITAAGEMINESDGPFKLSDVRLAAPRIGDVSLDLIVKKGGTWEVAAASDSLTLSGENLKRLGDFVPGFFGGWGTKGKVRGALTMGSFDGDDGNIAGTFEGGLIKTGFSSPDSLYLGDGISGTVRLHFRDDVRRGFAFDAEIDAHDFGLLLADLFVNFEKKRISVRTSGRLVEEDGVKDLKCEVSIPSVLSASLSGDLDFGASEARGDLTYHLTTSSLSDAFDLFFRDFFRNRISWLYTGTVAGSLTSRGTAGGNLSAPRISGNLTVAGSSIDLPDIDTRIEGISASLPFSLDLSGGSKDDARRSFSPDDFGEVAFSHATVGGVDIAGITVSPALIENALVFRDDIVISVSGGSVTVGKFSGTDIFSEDRTVGFSLDVEGVDIVRLFPKEELVNLEGVISGRLPDVRIAEKKLFTSGYLTATIFKGKINVENIWAQDIFDAGRRFGCDVTFSGIDLGVLTQTIDVGRVTGIAEGAVSDLIFSYGSPERFVFDVSTVNKRGVPKRVSVDFVNKLTILGSGSTLLSGVLKGGISRFISDYNYSKIGIHLELKNDYFTLRGTIHEGDKEYFIKRSGLTGINVINQNPNNRILFDDMVRRLERINVKDTEDIRIETK